MILSLCIKDENNIVRVKDAGFDAFEFNGAVLCAMEEDAFELLLKEQERTGLPCVGINAYSSGVPALVGPAYDRSECIRYAEKICARAAALGAAGIGIGAPKARILPEGFPKTQADAQFGQMLTDLAEIAGTYGIRVLIEALHQGFCNYINTTDEAALLQQSLKPGNLRLVFDFYHSSQQGEDAVEMFRRCKDRIAHVHFSSAHETTGRGYPRQPDRETCLAYLRVLHETGYMGAVSVEPDIFDADKAAECAIMLKECAALAGQEG